MTEPLTLYKLIILSMLDKVNFPLTNSQISGFILDKGYTTYFHLQQAISELIDTDLIQAETIRNASHLHLTKQGKKTIDFFGKDISEEIQKDIKEFLDANSYELRNEVSNIADFYKENTDEYIVRCQVKEKNSRLIDLNITVPTEEAAQSICSKWPDKSQEVYAYLMKMLL